MVELKAAPEALPSALAQLLHYLKATGFNCGLILNFGLPTLQIKRVSL